MARDVQTEIPDDLADRVDAALAALWRNDSRAFDRLLDELSDAGVSVGRMLQAAMRHEDARAAPPPDLTVAGYRIIRELGRGGMGVVYAAEQVRTRRVVALKLIRETHALDDYHKLLFEREVRTLARLKHPNIASVYDAGTSGDGHPFYAMELINGVSLTDFASRGVDGRGAPSLSERLRLFHRVCQAVSYAHQRGVIHRDLKPSNVLVTRREGPGSTFSGDAGGDVKVVDFGLARLMDDEAGPLSVTVDTGRLKGTLAYMSPEQARGDGDRVDVRSDVYSLGVLLYQMISGQMPYELRGAAVHDVVRIICEREPSALTLVGRGGSGGSRTGVPRDLRTVVLTALEKDPSRRYQSAAAFAEDIEHFLHNEPIAARPTSTAYQIRKLVARHKAPSAFAGALLVLVVGFGVYASLQASRLAAERDKALAAEHLAEERLVAVESARDAAALAAEEAEAINRFLQGMLASADPNRSGRDVKVVDILERAVAELDDAGVADPQVEAAVRQTLGTTYRTLSLYDPAESQLERAVELFTRTLGPDAARTLGARNEWGVWLQDVGRPVEAEAVFREVLEGQSRILAPDDPAILVTQNNLALVLQEQGRYAAAEPLFREVLAARRAVLGPEHKDTLQSMNNLAGILMYLKRWAEAEPLCRATLARQREVLGDEHPDTLVSFNDLAFLLKGQGRLAEAEPLYRQAFEGLRRTNGDAHLDTLITASNLTGVLRELGELEEAAALGRTLVDNATRALPAGNWYTAVFHGSYGQVLMGLERYDEAEPHLLSWYDGTRAGLGENHPYVIRALEALIDLYRRRDEPDKVEHYGEMLESAGGS